jgi:hypothetical protein
LLWRPTRPADDLLAGRGAVDDPRRHEADAEARQVPFRGEARKLGLPPPRRAPLRGIPDDAFHLGYRADVELPTAM